MVWDHKGRPLSYALSFAFLSPLYALADRSSRSLSLSRLFSPLVSHHTLLHARLSGWRATGSSRRRGGAGSRRHRRLGERRGMSADLRWSDR